MHLVAGAPVHMQPKCTYIKFLSSSVYKELSNNMKYIIMTFNFSVFNDEYLTKYKKYIQMYNNCQSQLRTN
jgi:hypothetical protein